MSLTLVDGVYVDNLTEDISQGQAKYIGGDYDRAVIVGATTAVDGPDDQDGVLRGSVVRYIVTGVDANSIPVINVRASMAILLSPKVIDELGNFLVDESLNNLVGG